MAVAVRRTDGTLGRADDVVTTWKERIEQAREYRKQFEPTWLSNLAFAAGQFWLVWDPAQKKLRHLSEVDPSFEERELFTADRINEQRQAQLGELATDDDRPQLLLAQEGESAAAIQQQINDAVAYAWEHEWNADKALDQADRLMLDLGHTALWCRFNKTAGPVTGHVPIDQNNQPITHPDLVAHLQEHGQLPDGSLPRFQPIHEGRTVVEALSALNLLTPPGINHEDFFPWEIVVRPALIDDLIETFGDVAKGLDEDTDIGSIIGLTAVQQAATGTVSSRGRLRKHVWLFTCFERPNRTHPKGQVVVLAGNGFRLLDVRDELDYCSPAGDYRSGLHYMHWWRLNDRFASRAFIEPMKDPQRLINRRETQNAEIIDRGMPKVFTKEGALVHDPKGLPLENIELSDTSLEPHFFQGIGPGQWMYEDIAHHVDNLAHASTLSPLRLGENPPGIQTYAQLALLNENEAQKRSRILNGRKQAIAGVIEDGVWDIRKYWPDQKMVLVSGDDDQISRQQFVKSRIPDFYVVKVARGSSQPRSQAAELAKIEAIWAAIGASGLATDPATRDKWVRWYAMSLDAGDALPLPEPDVDSQAEVAEYENFQMLHEGVLPQPADHDFAQVHIPIHHEAYDKARAAGDVETCQLIQQHIGLSIQKAVTARKMLRTLDPTDATDQQSDLALDEDQALRENQMMLHGVPLNPEAVRQAQAALAQGVDPDTGQTLASGADAQAILLHASLKPTLTENLQLHLDRHGKVIKSAVFATWPPDVRGRFLDHFDQTRDLWLSLPMMPAEIKPPQVTLNLRESVGPSTIADVLRRAGVPEADAQTIATEPPLENMVQRDDPPASANESGQHYEPRGPL